MPVRVQTTAFDAGEEIEQLRLGRPEVGAVVAFMGTVRDMNEVRGEARQVAQLSLEHYPGMTERVLDEICAEAKQRFEVIETLVVHRVGPLQPLEAIVLVVVLAAHRGTAFSACEFIMDDLKTRAPFWKKEVTPQGSRWVDSRDSDQTAAERWSVP